jgi:hypothetical protein
MNAVASSRNIHDISRLRVKTVTGFTGCPVLFRRDPKRFNVNVKLKVKISSDYFPKQRYLIGENDEEDVRSYIVTLRKREDTGNRKRKRSVALSENVAVVCRQAMLLSIVTALGSNGGDELSALIGTD